MSICRWCTPGASCTADFLSNYASKRLPPEDLAAASDDLCYCLECVVEYHKARDEVPSLHETLWELETSRLIAHMEKSMKEEIEEDDELFIVDENGETQLSGYTGPDFENNLRVPLLEILKYPYLLLHKRIGELCVEALCKMEQANSSFQVFEKHPGIYLLLVHPNEVIRRWAILTARNLGKVDRDDYYDLQEVLTCLFKVIELGLFDSPDIYCSSVIEKGKLVLLPSHLYDSANYKNYWLGICMLLTVLEEQAMDSLLLGPDKQNDFMQSILHTMEKQTDDDNADPFWPALHCFMVILDQLGSKVWGQLIDPVQAFQTIINNVSYNNEIQNIRNSSRRPKTEPESEYGEDMVTCSQIVYNYNTEKPKKDAGWKTAICPDYCPNMYEDMQTLANVLQSDIGQDMRVHNSTFLWFIPFVQSLMDLKDLGVAYIVEVIHHLCSEIKAVLNERVQQCDKVSEFFILILVSIIELHRNKKCLHLLWISSQEWVEAIVKCSKLPNVAFMRHGEKTPAISSQSFNSVQYACVQLIRSLLREGYQIGQQTLCKQYLDKLNLLLRGNISLGWHLSSRETQELQTCLKQVIKSIKDKSTSSSFPLENKVNLPKNEVGGDDDNHIPCTAIIGNLSKKISHAGRSSSLSKCLLNKDLNAESSGQEQSNFGNLHPRQDACKEQIVSKLHVAEISVGVSIPPISSGEGGRPSNTPQISPHSIKRESEDRPLTISRYFKREGVLERKNDESKEVIACDLANRISGSRTLTDSQLDRDLHKLSLAAYTKGVNFSLDSSQEIEPQHCLPDIMRKVKGAVRSSSNGPSNETSFDADCPNNQVIIISDSSSDDEKKIVIEKQTGKIDESICPEKQPLTSACVSDGVSKKEQMKSHSSPLPYEDYESQYFEFETEDDVFSVWQDSQMDDKNVNQVREQMPSAGSCSSNNLELEDETNEWGYDTDYISDDVIEQAAKDAEKQISSVFYQKKAGTAEIKSELTSQEPATKRNAADQVERSYTHLVAKRGTTKTSLTELRTSTSKASLAKKLAVKKGSASPSKSLAKSKVARAACRSPRKMNLKTTQSKKLPQASCKNTEPCRSTPAVVPPKKVRQCPKPTSTAEKLGLKKAPRKAFELSQRSLESMAELRNYGRVAGAVTVPQKQKTILIDPRNLRVKNNKKMLASQDLQFLRQTRPKQEGRGKNRVGSSGSRSKRIVKRSEEVQPNMFKLNENDDDDLFLTQSDPVDMEMCSQVENIIILPSKEPLEMEGNAAESLLQNEPSSIVMCKYKDCTEKVEKTGEFCSKHSLIDSSDHLFVKPLPPKIVKPPTTKIFSSNSSSRSASLSKDLENSSKLSLVSKNKLNAVKPAASKPVNPKAVSSENRVFKTPSFNSILRPQNSSNVLRAQNMQTKAVSNFQGWPAAQTCVGQEKRVSYFPQSNTLVTVQRDPTIFVKEVLKWNYEIFANFGSFGPPNNLLQAIVASVPVKFQGYNDYFDTFFPLMMLNAFETLAQEWQESQKVKEKNAYHLHLKKFSADLNQAEFTVYIRERDLVKQLHPKEEDLIFLVVREKQNPLAEESEMDCHPVRHVGHVTRFSRQNEQRIVCHLFVQTRGNLSSYINQQVKCEVVSSLVTTQRKFRGLLLLGRSPLAKAIIHPNYNDFCPRDLSTASERTTSYYKEYNEDQKKAIETAYAMVKQHPGLPRICLIHGPPGTGKSKTIVGLLFRILNEKFGKENPAQNMNAKIKRNRVLVCAPSNAAIDELMKKIILEFKEKCQNIKNPLGMNRSYRRLVRFCSTSFKLVCFSCSFVDRGHSGRDQDFHKRKEALDRQLDMLSRQRAMDRCEKREKVVRGRPQEVQASIILESHIICCTLSTSGGFLLESAFRRQGLDPEEIYFGFAGQACEVETLIPLIHRCSKLVLVGDPKQLPPTVISMKAQDYGYDQSLMARLHKHLEEQVQQNIIGKLPVVQLTVQYRMHPDICLFPSNYVYRKTLKTDRATEESRCSSDWPFQPYLVFDVADGHEKRDKDSFANPQEVKLVVELIKTIKEKRKDTGSRNIGIITPYNAQKKIIQQELDREFGKDRAGEVDTVDGFQGRQKDCIIVTCVRANSAHGSIGFLASLQRLNVTITRAKLSLFILGRLKTLMENKDWNELIQDAQRRGAIIKTSYKTYKKDAAKILKFKPALPRPPPRCPSTALPEKTTQGQPCSGSDRQVDVTNKKDSNSSRRQCDSAGPLAQDSGGLKRSQESQGSDARGVTGPTEARAAVQPAVQERQRDPRLAKRSEATGKEQAFKNGKPSPLRNPGMTSPRVSDASSAHRSQSSSVPPSVSKADTSTKSSQSERQPDLPVRSSHIARQDHDKNASVTMREAGTKSEGDQKNKTEGNKDRASLYAQRRASERSPEDTGFSSAKRRKISS
uniref:Senataxin n=1 Tax=Crocodylus porosus TaxID=8502 RepID=A0A7M4EFZ1_CROPO